MWNLARALRRTARVAASISLCLGLAACGGGGGGSSVAPPGYTPDPVFGSAGQHQFQVPQAFERLYAYAAHPDGSHVLGGNMNIPSDGMLVTVLHPDGTPDQSFGTNGIWTVESPDWDLHQVIVDDATGEIAVLGIWQNKLGVIRMERDGGGSPTFGFMGIVIHTVPTSVTVSIVDAVIGADGKTTVLLHAAVTPVLARLMPNGTLDTSFGGDGFATVGGSAGLAKSMELDTGGAVLVGGYLDPPGDRRMFVRRILANGTKDVAYGTGGQAVAGLPGEIHRGAYDMIRRPDGRLILMGAHIVSGGPIVPVWAGLTAGGQDDPQFATGTSPGPDVNLPTMHRFVRARLLPDGKVQAVFPGYPELPTAVVQVAADGTPDASFGPSGRRTVPTPVDFMGGGWDGQDGLILVGFDYTNAPDHVLVVARYLLN